MRYYWEDLPEKKNCFTVRSAAMVDLITRKVIRNYSANTKIVVTQKCVTHRGTFYRTAEAASHYLNYAFEASAFGLPNEKAPSVHTSKSKSLSGNAVKPKPVVRTAPVEKQTRDQKVATPKDGGEGRLRKWFKGLLRRKNG